MWYRLYRKILDVVLICVILHFSACYSPIIHLQNVALLDDDALQSQMRKEKYPLIFYKECSRNGSAWMYECQSIGLESIQQAIYLYYPNVLVNNITIRFFPQKTYIRFEVDDSSVLQDASWLGL